MIEVVRLTSADTHDLRHTVLRIGTPSNVVVFDGDEDPTTFHVGVRVDGELTAISTWLARRHPDRPERPAYQLRGMATTPVRRGCGDGTRTLDAGLAACVELGADLVWARARVSALDFYRRRGFETVGGEYVDPTTALPHRDIVRSLTD